VPEPRPVARTFEWLVPVGMVVALFAAFMVAQLTVMFGGHEYLHRTTGLTYAAYVHQGFVQLTVATALTILVVAVTARKAPRSTRFERLLLRGMLGALCLLTLVVVASALYRLDVYEDAYGFTRLRLLVSVFEGWLGVVVVLVMVAGIGLRGRWLPRAALVTGAVALLALAISNPDASIAEHNLQRYADTGKVDGAYLHGLSADATPALAGTGFGPRCEASHDDWLGWNLGRARADDACRGR
jgi:two-component system sensor histidine kinase BaeS